MKTKLKLTFALATLAALIPAHLALAQGTAFTYQGRLNDGATPANGNYDLKFTLFGVSSGGSATSGPVTNAPVGISNGLFTVTLDFGSGVFTGAARWLEIGVRSNGSATAYVTLGQRQQLTPTPYAIFAGTSSNVISGSVVASLNNLKDNVTLAAGTNVTITPSGNTLTIASAGAGGSGIWSVNANNAYYTAGNVGIGTASPSGKLTVVTADDTNPGLISSFDTRHTVIGTPSSGLGFSYSSTLGSAYVTALSPNIAWRDLVLQAQSLSFRASGNSGAFSIVNNGSVGIGIANPLTKLHLYNSGGSVSERIQTGGGINSIAQMEFVNDNGQWNMGTSRGFNSDVFYLDRAGNSALELQLAPNGNLGLGVEPSAKLHLYDPVNSVSHRIQTGGGNNAWTRIELANANGQWEVGTSRAFNGDQLYFNRAGGTDIAFAIQPNGDARLEGTLSCKVLAITSDRDEKENFAPVSPLEALDKVVSLPISRWNFKGSTAAPHIGPMAQDFYAAFGVGADERHIATVDEGGVALAAIQGLNQKLEEQINANQAKDVEIQGLKHRLESLEKLLQTSTSRR